MPKIINDLQVTILKEAKRQVFENGYSSMTIRSVAKGCGIAVGTIYGYYPSKDYLIACFVLNDWVPLEEKINSQCKAITEPMEAFQCVYNGLLKFISDYQPLFKEKTAQRNASIVFQDRHCMMRGRLAEMIRGICMEKARKPMEFLPEFVAEVLLSWSSEQHSFEEISAVLSQLFIKGDEL